MTAPSSGLTAQLADFASHPGRLRIDDKVRRRVIDGFTDTAAVILAGRQEPVVGVVMAFVASHRSQRNEASLLWGPKRASARDAAMVNATAGHALDFDDVALQGHPSVVLVPALMAEGERLGASGEKLVEAYVVGYEVWAELLLRDRDVHHLKGWHPTGVFGVVAVAAAVACLRGLGVDRVQHALGLAASMAGGLVANFGSMAKPFHAGLAASHGIDAVDLAEAGMTASPDAFERATGFLAAISPAGRVERGPATSLGSELRITTHGLTVKKYPMCFATHRLIDATLDLALANDLAADDVARVDVTIGVAQASMLRNHAPTSALEAKFSAEFAVACAIVARQVGLAQLHDDWVRRADVRQLAARVHIVTTDTVCDYEPTLAKSDRVVLTLSTGRRLDSGEVEGTRGDAATPLGPHELRAKFRDCASAVDDIDAMLLFDALQRLDEAVDVGRLRASCTVG